MVEDAHQGRGIGSVLLEHLADAAREDGHQPVRGRGAAGRTGRCCGCSPTPASRSSREYADGVVHLSVPDRARPSSRCEVQRGREQRTEAALDRPAARPARRSPSYGASAEPAPGIGAALLGHLRDGGFTGADLPGAPAAPATVAGLPAYPRAADARIAVDLAVVAVPGRRRWRGGGRRRPRPGVHGLVVVSAGFAEAGPAGAAAQRALVRVGPRRRACGWSDRTAWAWSTPTRRSG